MKYSIFVIICIISFGSCAVLKPYTENDSTLATDILELDEPSYSTGNGETYYISSSGDDTNSGTSSIYPWKSISHLNKQSLSAGDSVLFKRGEVFYGQIEPQSGTISQSILYSSYGTGKLPLILGSASLSNSSDWVHHSGNIYRTAETIPYDVGGLFLDLDETRFAGDKKWELSELGKKGDFYFSSLTDEGYLYLYWDNNPAISNDGVNASLNTHIVNQNNLSFAVFDSLHFSMGGAHGFGGHNTENLIIINCEFSYIGGGYLYTDYDGLKVRFGNAIEFWGNAKNNLVKNNIIYQIYDTAITNQNHTSSAVQENIFYVNNRISDCGLAGFEFWNRPASSSINRIFLLHNTFFNIGHGWGSDRPDKNSFFIASYYNQASFKDVYIYNNFFYTETLPADSDNYVQVYLEDVSSSLSNIHFSHNLWYSPEMIFFVNNATSDSINGFYKLLGSGDGGIYKNPQMTDPLNGNFSLLSNSPAIAAAVSTYRFSDATGKYIGESPDIGALEY